MFKKHITMAAAAMLAISTTVSLAECAPAWGFQPDFQQGCSSCMQDCGATRGASCATFGCTDTTCGITCATCSTCTPTFGTNCSSLPVCDPTAVPQPTQPVTTPAPAPTQAPSTGDDYTTQSVSAQEQKMVNLLNQDRAANGLSALTLDPELCRIARIKSADMRDNGYFAHESPTYGRVGDMLKRFGYSFRSAGENIAHHANVDKAQAAFMSSSGHRANILGSWTKVGVGIVTDAQGYIYATQIFAK